MFNKKNSVEEWDSIWSKDNSLRFFMLSPIYDYILKYTKSSDTVLELGAGVGFLADRLRAQKDCKVIGVDHSQVAIETLETKGHFAKKLDLLEEKDVDKLKVRKIDLVVATEVLEHLPDDKRDYLLKTIAPLSPAIFSVPNDRLGPEVEHQHYIKWNLKEFESYLKQYYSKVEIKTIGDNIVFPGFLVAVCGELEKDKKDTLSIAYTLKNEGATIYEAMKTVKNVADEIIIGIDSATTDNTEEECLRALKDFNIPKYEIFRFQWANSFCKARNAVLEKCTSDWIFVVDGHEFLTKDSEIYMKNLHNIPPIVSNVACQLYMFENNENTPSSFFFFQKLIRNFMGIHYIYDVHNRISVPAGLQGFSDKVIVEHKRGKILSDQRKEQRIRMNAKGLRKQYKDTKDPRHLFYLGNTQAAHGYYKSAIKAYKDYLKVGKVTSERILAKISLSKCYDYLKEYEKSYKILLSSFEEDNYKAEVYLMLGQRAMLLGKFNEGRRWLKMATTLPFPVVAADIFIYASYTYLPWVKLAECEMRAGYLEEAQLSLKKARSYKNLPDEVKETVSLYEETINKTLEENT